MEAVCYGNKKITFEIKRGNRKKTAAIHVTPAATVVISVPRDLEEERVCEIIEKKARWIIEKKEFMNSRSHFNVIKEFVSGESFLYLGKQFRLKVTKSSSRENSCRLVAGRFQVQIEEDLDAESHKEAVKKALVEWYKKHAEEKILERLPLIARKAGIKPKAVEIKNQHKRWGSCSRSGVVRFNWKVVMTPISVIDYVIAHELCHLIYGNHSAQFWEKVKTIYPEYKTKKDWLKKHIEVSGLDM
jgi:predicted metal-dependent hydrolase